MILPNKFDRDASADRQVCRQYNHVGRSLEQGKKPFCYVIKGFIYLALSLHEVNFTWEYPEDPQVGYFSDITQPEVFVFHIGPPYAFH